MNVYGRRWRLSWMLLVFSRWFFQLIEACDLRRAGSITQEPGKYNTHQIPIIDCSLWKAECLQIYVGGGL